jgi:hypothetical protein
VHIDCDIRNQKSKEKREEVISIGQKIDVTYRDSLNRHHFSKCGRFEWQERQEIFALIQKQKIDN